MAAAQMSDVASDTGSVPDEEQQTLNLVLKLLRSFQDGQSGILFACGGTVPIPSANNVAQQPPTNSGSGPAGPPITLRWDSMSKSVPGSKCKLQFPLDQSDSVTAQNLQQLLRDMQPVTFGFQGQDVLEESYRKASKLDPSHFACTFSPHELGIIDEVARVLLPSFQRKIDLKNKAFCAPHTERLSVMRAELYKLNVYTGPSGHFKTHVDTPRSTDQIGSLVVCLPCVHQGGQLEVRHEGRTKTFDWSMPESARAEIQWAAFYSDCEHEVLEVTAGHCITLTYNLYLSTVTDTQQVGNGVMDPTQMPLYGILCPLFLQENFMPDGGYLGVYTSHAYPHTTSSAHLPSTLKGADVVVWETFRSLGCRVTLQPVVELPEWAHYGHDHNEACPALDLTDTSSEGCRSHSDNENLRFPDIAPAHQFTDGDTDTDEVDHDQDDDGDRPMDDVAQPMAEIAISSAQGSVESVSGLEDVSNLEEKGDDDQSMAEAPALPIGPERWEIDADELKALQQEAKELQSLPTSEFKGLEPAGLLVTRCEEEEEEEKKEVVPVKFEQFGIKSGCRVLGNGLSFYRSLSLLEDSADMDWLIDHWMKQKPYQQPNTGEKAKRVLYEDVAWLNQPGNFKEPQINYGVYGNEAEASIMYSVCGIVARLPPWTQRKAFLDKE